MVCLLVLAVAGAHSVSTRSSAGALHPDDSIEKGERMTDCAICRKIVKASIASLTCAANPCEVDLDLGLLDGCHERVAAVTDQLRAAGAPLAASNGRGHYRITHGCADLRQLPSQIFCVRHALCLSRCDVCERMLSYWHSNGCRGSPCTEGPGHGRRLTSSLDCWDALTDMQRGGLLVEDRPGREMALTDCAQIAHTRKFCELTNFC